MNLTLEQYEQLNPRCEIVHEGTRMTFMTPSAFTKWRVDSIYTKEPCTLEWIAGFGKDEVLIDIGANVGMYSVWAAATRQARVFAFEPESQNYALLNKNIMVNRLQDRVRAYCIGLSDKATVTDLFLSEFKIGGSCHTVGQSIDFKLAPMTAVYRQGCPVFKLDDLVASNTVPIPNHIKIDVDGIEHKVLAGAANVLKQPALRSLLIETNLNLVDHQMMVDVLTSAGFKHDPSQVQRAMRRDGPFKGVAEHVFKR
jgi:FkbM family methyltransferase